MLQAALDALWSVLVTRRDNRRTLTTHGVFALGTCLALVGYFAAREVRREIEFRVALGSHLTAVPDIERRISTQDQRLSVLQAEVDRRADREEQHLMRLEAKVDAILLSRGLNPATLETVGVSPNASGPRRPRQ